MQLSSDIISLLFVSKIKAVPDNALLWENITLPNTFMVEPTACTLEILFVVKLQFLIVKKELYTEITAGKREGFVFLPRSVN